MKTRIQITRFLLMLLLLLVLAGCGGQPDFDSASDAGFVPVCEISDELLGWRAQTRGEITFIDLSPSDGVYMEIVDGGCQIGIFFHNDFWGGFTEEEQGYVAYGNVVEVNGIVAKSGGDLHVTCQSIELVN